MFNTMVSDNIQAQILIDIANTPAGMMDDVYAFMSDRLEQDEQDMRDFDNALNQR